MQEEKIDKYVSDSSLTVVEAMQQIDENAKGILFVLDKLGHLIGTVTDGDIRRWIIKTGDLQAEIADFMHTSPKYLYSRNRKQAQNFMHSHSIRALPILDDDSCVVDIVFDSVEETNHNQKKTDALKDIPVVIMAGGKGTRLYPYTKILPKPLIPIGDVPIVERIIHRFCEYGVTEYYLTVNYKKGMIKSYFADSMPSYHVNYIEENDPLGTAGSLRLFHEEVSAPIIVTNCDILIDADYTSILRYHTESGNKMTIVSALKNIMVPYGVLHAKEQGVITSIEEKPQISYFVNTGMYILDPECIQMIPENTVFHMTDLMNLLMEKKQQIGMYPVSEEAFLDMGEFEEMQRMEEKLEQRME